MTKIYYREDKIDLFTYRDGERSAEKPIAFLFGGNGYVWHDLEEIEPYLKKLHKTFCDWVIEHELVEGFRVELIGAVLKEYDQGLVNDVWFTDMERAATTYKRAIKVLAFSDEEAMLFRLRFADIIAECEADV